jgi:hypothetical protein
VLGQAELVVIDEAAAIPLPHVRALLGPYLVFLASTINGCARASRRYPYTHICTQSHTHLSHVRVCMHGCVRGWRCHPLSDMKEPAALSHSS